MSTITRRRFAISFAVLVGMSAGAATLAQETPAEIEGEVIQLTQQTRNGEPGGLDAVMVRTRQGERVRLLLGEAGSCEGCVRVGDQVRARLSKNGATGDAYQVRAMKVKRTGEKIRFRDASGQLLRDRFREQARDRDRIHQPATGNGGRGGVGSRGGAKGSGRR
jgi:hypothetical protein